MDADDEVCVVVSELRKRAALPAAANVRYCRCTCFVKSYRRSGEPVTLYRRESWSLPTYLDSTSTTRRAGRPYRVR